MTIAETLRLIQVGAIKVKQLKRSTTYSCVQCSWVKSLVSADIGQHVRDEHFNRFGIAMMGVTR